LGKIFRAGKKDSSTVGAATRLFHGFFSEVSNIYKNSGKFYFVKNYTLPNHTITIGYTLPNHTITIGVCNLETQLSSLLYGLGASFGQKWSMPRMSAII
jgi:hypothetical protein